ncbi:MAG: hypothetical protein ACTSRR_07790 [Candidatus Heimdallarchaeaceae archaeon]
MTYQKVQDHYLDNRLEKALAKIANINYDNSPVYIEVCNCPLKGGKLFYNANKKTYFTKGTCSPSKLCYSIQKDRHNAKIARDILSYQEEDCNVCQKEEKLSSYFN